jgi:hypothetical protein
MAPIFTPTTLPTQILQKHQPLTSAWRPVLDTLQVAAPDLYQDHLRSLPLNTIVVNPALHRIRPHSFERRLQSAALPLALAPGLTLVLTI